MKKQRKIKGERISKTKKDKITQIKNLSRQENIEEINNKEKINPVVVKYTKAWQPTLFKSKYAQEMLEYFESRTKDGYFEEYTEEQVAWKDAKVVVVIKKRVKTMPTFEGFALSIGIDHHTLRRWAIKKDENGQIINKEFCSSYKRCLAIAEKMIKELSLTWHYNSNIAKLLLWAEHSIYEIKDDNDQTKRWETQAIINDINIDESLQDVLK